MSSSKVTTVQDLRTALASFGDDEPLDAVWQTDEGKVLLKQVSRLVRRNESKSGQAGTSPRDRALKAITDSEQLEFAPELDFASWSRNHSLFWTVNVAFGGRTHVNILYETLASRFKMLTYLDDATCSLRIRRRFLCLFFHDFSRLIQPNAERIGAALLQSIIHQLRLCGFDDIDTEYLRKNLTMGRRLDELARISGVGTLFCLPKAADDGNR